MLNPLLHRVISVARTADFHRDGERVSALPRDGEGAEPEAEPRSPATPPPVHASPWPPRTVELYDAWLFAEADATIALADWRRAPSPGAGSAYAAYRAAAEREATAATALATRLTRPERT
jgi:hypothetical protein